MLMRGWCRLAVQLQRVQPRYRHVCDKSNTGSSFAIKYNSKLMQEESIKRSDVFVEFPAARVDDILVRMFGGNVVIATHPADSSAVTANKITVNIQWDPARPQLYPQVTFDNNKLSVRSSGIASFIGQKGAYVVEVLVPPRHRLNTHVRMGVGTVHLSNILGKCKVNLGVGSINGILISDARINLGIGSMSMGLPCLVPSNKIKVSAGIGHVGLYVPEMPSLTSCDEMSTDSSSNKTAQCGGTGYIANCGGADLRASVGLGDVVVKVDPCLV